VVQEEGLVRLGVISDTHLPRRGRWLPAVLHDLFKGVDLILHAGDFIEPSVFYELAELAPTRGVLGNCDVPELASIVPTKDSFVAGGVRIGMIHDSGSLQGRRARMSTTFPDHRVVVFGHSHRPLIEDDGSLLLLNPGSACDPRAAKIPTVALLEIAGGEPQAELIELSGS
jgi:putative phosphoesterase